LILISVIMYICFSSCKTMKPVEGIKQQAPRAMVPDTRVISQPDNFSDPSTWLLGYFNPDRLRQIPYSDWFTKGYDEYSIDSKAINKLLDINKDNVKIKVIMGTWCSDSRREVPGFMRILDIWKFPVSQLSFIGVDKAKNSPVEEIKSLGILKVPTFIFYKNNIEAGRIIENPVTSLVQDMVNILGRNE
jgi:thiol-disulfide isomerase/thioredoxin